MGALRKAGVWLGLVEDDDDHEFDDSADAYDRPQSRYRANDGGRGLRQRYEEDFEDDDDVDLAPVRSRAERMERASADRAERVAGSSRLGLESDREITVPRAPVRDSLRESRTSGIEARLEQARADRATVRPITRPVSGVGSGQTQASTRDNLALAPQPAQRTAPAVEDERRPQITTLHPTTYNEARQIGERFRDGSPVIMNLTEMDEADAKRLVDFAAGLAFGLRGTIERVTNRVFLLSPANVQVTAEDKAKIAEGSF
jgi:cell division inhibitor SepF